MDTPHVPHNTPEGEVGKPEGLSGSQIEAMFLLTLLCILPHVKVCVNISGFILKLSPQRLSRDPEFLLQQQSEKSLNFLILGACLGACDKQDCKET